MNATIVIDIGFKVRLKLAILCINFSADSKVERIYVATDWIPSGIRILEQNNYLK